MSGSISRRRHPHVSHEVCFIRLPLRPGFAATLSVLAILALPVAEAGPIWDLTTDAKGGVGRLETLTWNFNGARETGMAGTLTTRLPDGTSSDTYCVDLYSTTKVGNGGSTWSAEVLPIGIFGGNPAGSPTGGNGGAIGYLYSRYAASVSTAIQGAALQLAIWKVEYDNSASLSTDSFRLADSQETDSVQHQTFVQLTKYLDGFDGSKATGDATLFRATSHPNGLYQDLVGDARVVTSANTAVPEPSSLVLLAAGIGALAINRRRIGDPTPTGA